MRVPLLLGLFIVIPNNIGAPGPQDLRSLYGEPAMERFTVRSGITVTVEYGPDRLACQLLIEPQQTLVEIQNQGPPMSSQEVFEVLDQLVPVSTRGRQVGAESVQIEGGKLLRTDYENVSIRRVCAVDACGPSTENQELRTLVVLNRGACPKRLEAQ
jgi:hypothetical protein